MGFGNHDLYAKVEVVLLLLRPGQAILESEARRMCCISGTFCSNTPLAYSPDQSIYDNHYTTCDDSNGVANNVDKVVRW